MSKIFLKLGDQYPNLWYFLNS